MSGLAVVWNRSGRAVAARDLDPVIASLAHRAVDGSRVELLGEAALGHCHFWTVPEEVGERQPLQRRELALVFDGRIDNRSEIERALDDKVGDSGMESDACLFLRAFGQWGPAGFHRIVGPWAAALWDSRSRRLVLARDPMGSRDLTYLLRGDLLVAASEPLAVTAHPEVELRLDEHRIAVEVGLRPVHEDAASFFADVSHLVPGHVLVVDRESERLTRFWEPQLEDPPSRRTDGEYAEEFRGLLDQAVACRLRASAAPAVLMSGGLDSTPVAASAARQWPARGNGRIAAISWVFDELTQCDERSYVEAMVQSFDLEVMQVPGDDAWPLRADPEWPVDRSTPVNNAFRHLFERALRAAEASGRRVVLSGHGGDDLYVEGERQWLADLLVEGRFSAAARQILAEARTHGVRRALFGPAPRGALRRLLPARIAPASPPEWLTPEAARLLKPRSEEWSPMAVRPRRPRQLERMLGLRSAYGHAALGEMLHRCGAEIRWPFHDRRLVEFALDLPAHQLYRDGRPKAIARQAFAGILPEAVRNRTDRSLLTPLYRRGLERERETIDRVIERHRDFLGKYVKWPPLPDLRGSRRLSEEQELLVLVLVNLGLWRSGLGLEGHTER